MTATNDITGQEIKSKPASDKYRESKLWENIDKERKKQKEKKDELDRV